jgi:hypothetical protein
MILLIKLQSTGGDKRRKITISKHVKSIRTFWSEEKRTQSKQKLELDNSLAVSLISMEEICSKNYCF